MDKKNLNSVVSETLSGKNFHRDKNYWYRKTADVIQILNLQKSEFGDAYYVNLCLAPFGMAIEGMPKPKEHKCPIKIRATAAFPAKKAEIEEAFNLETMELNDERRVIIISQIILDFILPFFEKMNTIENISRYVNEGVFTRGMVSLSVRNFLNEKI